MTAIKPVLLWRADTAKLLGAVPYAHPPRHCSPDLTADLITAAALRVEVEGRIPILIRNEGSVWAWPVLPGARDTGARM